MNLFGQLPNEIVLHAKASLEILLRAYYLRHGFDYMDSYLIALLMETCLTAIVDSQTRQRDKDLPGLQSTIILHAKGIHEQGRSLFLGKLILQLVRGKMRSADIEMLKFFIKDDLVNENEVSGMKQSPNAVASRYS